MWFTGGGKRDETPGIERASSSSSGPAYVGDVNEHDADELLDSLLEDDKPASEGASSEGSLAKESLLEDSVIGTDLLRESSKLDYSADSTNVAGNSRSSCLAEEKKEPTIVEASKLEEMGGEYEHPYGTVVDKQVQTEPVVVVSSPPQKSMQDKFEQLAVQSQEITIASAIVTPDQQEKNDKLPRVATLEKRFFGPEPKPPPLIIKGLPRVAELPAKKEPQTGPQTRTFKARPVPSYPSPQIRQRKPVRPSKTRTTKEEQDLAECQKQFKAKPYGNKATRSRLTQPTKAFQAHIVAQKEAAAQEHEKERNLCHGNVQPSQHGTLHKPFKATIPKPFRLRTEERCRFRNCQGCSSHPKPLNNNNNSSSSTTVEQEEEELTFDYTLEELLGSNDAPSNNNNNNNGALPDTHDERREDVKKKSLLWEKSPNDVKQVRALGGSPEMAPSHLFRDGEYD